MALKCLCGLGYGWRWIIPSILMIYMTASWDLAACCLEIGFRILRNYVIIMTDKFFSISLSHHSPTQCMELMHVLVDHTLDCFSLGHQASFDCSISRQWRKRDSKSAKEYIYGMPWD